MMVEFREDNVSMAKLAEQSERYEEMAEFREKVTEMVTENGELSIEERDLLSVAWFRLFSRKSDLINGCWEESMEASFFGFQ
ncbi:hypothetical protein KFK09_019130 [Dendrobium nobile]|uniref:14-3-3 domain-containing protein n=1 Tax=Dendrobium nobile TaxID=94219 RepID=A0A8T3AZ35_DENNO|nr:hypothetical protein KFK09_019130 [Dendrobium nobile]